MLFRPLRLHRVFAGFSTLPTSIKWRADLKNRSLAAQASSLLLHRKDWVHRLRSKPSLLPNPAPDDLVRRILSMTRSRPEISLQFFSWAQSNLGFRPSLKANSAIVRTLVDAGLLDEARQLIDPVLASHPPLVVVDLLARTSHCKDSSSTVLNFLLESYSSSGLIAGMLESLRKIVAFGCQITTRSCNALLDAFCSSNLNWIGMAWCCYATAVRNGFAADSRTWSLLVRLFCMEGKLERAVILLGLGSCTVSAYDMVIDCYCKKGDFGVAINLLKGMHEVNLRPRFSTYSTILDGACRLGDKRVVDSIIVPLITHDSIGPCLDYDLFISRLCELEKSNAAKMFFDRVRNQSIELGEGVYIRLLKTFSNGGMVQDAMKVYAIMSEKEIKVNPSSYNVFISGICNGDPSREVDQVLEDVIKRGFVPKISDLSKYIAAQCSKAMWEEAGDLVDLALDNDILLDAFYCYDLVKQYCTNNHVDLAMELHNRLKKLGGCFDLCSYKLLLKALFGERRIEEATQVFDYMQEKSILDIDSFVIMICELCHVRDMRKAMNLHDEMLKRGHKPDEASYKDLICHFS
ncbi:hypothetical protein Cni_G23910 [Canna indica]|uniref:Pentatricopeptide repeat-containing protein n=1 Tax=Canna indica TaxID=4628 RepID=A0AAQ3KUR1_9LILI|nr:hypothetical protein Cni_G23910 [Canna indica]